MILGWCVGNGENVRFSLLVCMVVILVFYEDDFVRCICSVGVSCLMCNRKWLNSVLFSVLVKLILNVLVVLVGLNVVMLFLLMVVYKLSILCILGLSFSVLGVGVRLCGIWMKRGLLKILCRWFSECEIVGVVMCIFLVM